MFNEEYYVSWIIADYTPFTYSGKPYFIASPSREDRFLAEQTYLTIYQEALTSGVLSEKEITKLLRKYNLWDDSQDNIMIELRKNVEQYKVDLFKSYTQSSRVAALRKTLQDTRKYLDELYNKKTQLDYLGSKYAAQVAKQHYLMGKSLFKRKNIPVYRSTDWCRKYDDGLLNAAYKALTSYSLSEGDYRSLARSTAWRNVWHLRKGGNLFGRASVDFSAQQRQLVMYSNMYDNIYKNPDCPADEVIEDDDILDGWLIEQKRKRDTEGNKNTVMSKVTDKVANSEEIYILCNPEDTKKVVDCNDVAGKIALRMRQKQVEEEGCVPEQRSKDRLQEINRQLAAARKG